MGQQKITRTTTSTRPCRYSKMQCPTWKKLECSAIYANSSCFVPLKVSLWTTFLDLFLDTVNFYSCETASGMRYRKETMLYWIFEWLIFHGKWLRFNRGIKFSGSCLETDSNRGFCSPDSGKTRKNFAVPSDQVIQNYVNSNPRVPSNSLELSKTCSMRYQMMLRRGNTLLFLQWCL